MNILWLGLYLSLNYTTAVNSFSQLNRPSVETTALIGLNKAVVTAIYIQPMSQSAPLVSLSVGFRVF